jgi:hypothetical protein
MFPLLHIPAICFPIGHDLITVTPSLSSFRQETRTVRNDKEFSLRSNKHTNQRRLSHSQPFPNPTNCDPAAFAGPSCSCIHDKPVQVTTDSLPNPNGASPPSRKHAASHFPLFREPRSRHGSTTGSWLIIQPEESSSRNSIFFQPAITAKQRSPTSLGPPKLTRERQNRFITTTHTHTSTWKTSVL